MIQKTETLTQPLFYPKELLVPPEQTIFFDIETTGLSAAKSSLYLIGAVYFSDERWKLHQWMAVNPAEEYFLLQAFQDFAAPFSFLIHFNGDTFDLPYLKKKAGKYGLTGFLEAQKSLDLLRILRPLKKLLLLPRMNQTTLEHFLDISREDQMDGGALIPVYHQFVKEGGHNQSHLLLLHNHDDLLGMLQLLPLLNYTEFWNGNFKALGCELDCEDDTSFSLIIRLLLHCPVPKSLSRHLEYGYLRAEGTHASLLIHGIKDTLKHFFPNCRDYYYLPSEDTAVHKSIGAYVDREHRVQATASTCYCKKTGAFLPDLVKASPHVFRPSFSDSMSYLEVTPEFLNDCSSLAKYSFELLHSI